MAVSYLHPEPPTNHAFPVRRQTEVLDSHPSYSAYPCRNLPHYPLPDGGADAPDAQAEIHSAHTQNQITATGCLVFICSGYYLQHARYQEFIQNLHGKKLVILEFGIGWRNQMIKAPLMHLAAVEPQARYITFNKGEIYIPEEIKEKSIGVDGNLTEALKEIRK